MTDPFTRRPPTPLTPPRPPSWDQPKRKIKTISLECCADGYRIVKLTDSVAFTCGDTLSRSEVEKLCESPNWSVRIFRNGGFVNE